MKLSNYINGELVEPVSGRYLDYYEPATAKVLGQLPDSDDQDLELAVRAGAAAFTAWSSQPSSERAAVLNRLADLIDENLERLAEAESANAGKPLSLARAVDIPRSSSNFRFFASACVQFSGQAFDMPDQAINYTLHQPLGVVGCISPWNLPLYLFSWKIAPALAAGNCVVAKPSEITPLTAGLLSELAIEAGMPKGVLNIVHGTGARIGASLVSHPNVKAISFTGGTQTGAHIAAAAAPVFKKLSLELGGKNPSIVFDDANLDLAVSETVRAAFFNQGEVCLCGSRVLIHDSIYEQFTERFVAEVKMLHVGDPAHADTRIGAMVSSAHRDKVLSYIELAREEGGRVLTGGRTASVEGRCKDGWFIEPTVVDSLAMSCRVNQEEIFGPVVTLNSFSDESDAIAQANQSVYGLAASVWSENIGRCHRVAAALEAGLVWVNTWMLRDLRTPFGGAKQSGVGREGGFEAMKFFTETKNVCVKINHD